MNQKYNLKLEYDKVLTILSSYCKTYIGKDICFHLEPYSEKEKVTKAISETTEAIRIRYQKGNLPITSIPDIEIWIKALDSNQILPIKALLELTLILKLSRELKEYFDSENDHVDTSGFSILSSFFASLYTNSNIEKHISRVLIDENTISDQASTRLFDIRRKKKHLEQEIKDFLSQLIHSSSYSKYLQDPVITIRNGRYVIPVKDEYRSNIKGFIHDISSSGSTVFIEPMSIFEKNNQIHHLTIEENVEIEVILSDLTTHFLPYVESLRNNIRIIGRLDFLFAKANYAIAQNATEPILNDQKKIVLKKARHPLIDPSCVIPIDFVLGDSYQTLVITGPNTGGKTVTLKTVGLLVLMAMSGLYIPTSENSSIYVFDHVFADIGDEQSIQESLSTFSSHMLNIIDIIKHSSSNSLILVDELGSGTDPIEGSNLAISILEYFYKKGILTIATTHYPEIKNYALVTDGFENASQEFDVENLKPTYRLLIGVPGKSNAFAISQKLGLDSSILNRANKLMNQSTVQIEDLLKSIYDNKLEIEKEKEETDLLLKQSQELKNSLEKEHSNVQKMEQELINKAKLEAREILSNAKNTATKLIREMKSNASSSDSIRSLEQIRNQLNDQIKNTVFNTTLQLNLSNQLKSSDLTIGMSIYSNSFSQEAILLSLPNKDEEVQIQIGNIKTKVKLSDLSSSSHSLKPITQVAKAKSSFKSKQVSTEINVIGQNVEEATFVIDKYLDDCSLAKLETVRIIHGKGTGKLREGIHQFLKKNPHVKSYRIGTFGEGEMGATIVTLK